MPATKYGEWTIYIIEGDDVAEAFSVPTYAITTPLSAFQSFSCPAMSAAAQTTDISASLFDFGVVPYDTTTVLITANSATTTDIVPDNATKVVLFSDIGGVDGNGKRKTFGKLRWDVSRSWSPT